MRRKILSVKNEGIRSADCRSSCEELSCGLGDPVFDKLEADLSKALMSIPAIKGVEIGSGFAAARMKGSENNDAFYKDKKSGKIRTRTNNAGEY